MPCLGPLQEYGEDDEDSEEDSDEDSEGEGDDGEPHIQAPATARRSTRQQHTGPRCSMYALCCDPVLLQSPRTPWRQQAGSQPQGLQQPRRSRRRRRGRAPATHRPARSGGWQAALAPLAVAMNLGKSWRACLVRGCAARCCTTRAWNCCCQICSASAAACVGNPALWPTCIACLPDPQHPPFPLKQPCRRRGGRGADHPGWAACAAGAWRWRRGRRLPAQVQRQGPGGQR